jgi:hypothetical protein
MIVLSDISNIGKRLKCSNCGENKIILSENFSENSDIHNHYCKECTVLLDEKTKCRFCEQEIKRKDLPEHVAVYHSK